MKNPDLYAHNHLLSLRLRIFGLTIRLITPFEAILRTTDQKVRGSNPFERTITLKKD